MNNKFMSVLAIVCAVLVLIIVGEWFYAAQAKKYALTPTTPKATKTTLDEMPDIGLSEKTEESYADLVTRPLFIKGRRPVDEPSPEAAQAINVANTFDWQLNGVYTTKQGLSALFSRTTSKVPKDNHRKIAAGADLDGWKLAEIHKDKAILKQGEQQKELLLRKPKLKAVPKNPNVPNMPNMRNMPNSPQPEVSPQPEDIPQPEDSPQPEEGEFENNNEQF